MKRFFFSLIALAAVAASCTQSALVETPDLNGTEITFNPYTGRTPVTRATDIVKATGLANAGGFQVIGFIKQGNNESLYMEKAVTDVMDLTVDQRRLTRAATTMSGSVDVNAQAPADEKVSVTGVTLDQTELTIVVPQTATLVATVTPADATNNAVKWTSDKEDVATVENGVVTAVAEGTANITVTTVDGEFTATCVVTVQVADGVLDIQVLDKTAPMYDVLGRQVDNNYHGVVIQNGTTFFL